MNGMKNYNKSDFGICITTFSKRFSYVENLVNSIRDQTDLDIFININGDYKKNINDEYRNKILNLCLKYKNIYPRFYNIFRSYGYMCNDYICNGGKLYNIITNDDIVIKNNFLNDFLNFIDSLNLSNTLIRVNNSFSTFLISRELARKNKFYDERYIGLGCEDSDFYHRLLRNNFDSKLVSFETTLYLNNWAETWNTLIDQGATTIAKYHNFNYVLMYELNKKSIDEYANPRPNEEFFFNNYDTFWNYTTSDTDYLEGLGSFEINSKK